MAVASHNRPCTRGDFSVLFICCKAVYLKIFSSHDENSRVKQVKVLRAELKASCNNKTKCFLCMGPVTSIFGNRLELIVGVKGGRIEEKWVAGVRILWSQME